jgi:chemotaxis protein MotB
MAGKGGGSWKVAYADFVTAMMAFFMVMWITAQNQEAKEAVSNYFQDPFAKTGDSTGPVSALKGGNPATNRKGEQGKRPGVKVVPSDPSGLGTTIQFAHDSAELSEDSKKHLASLAPELVGIPQRIEIRGHASRVPLAAGSAYHDAWALSYARCQATMAFLVEQGIEADRLRLSQAAIYQPVASGETPEGHRQNERVEVFVLREFVPAALGIESSDTPREEKPHAETPANHAERPSEPHDHASASAPVRTSHEALVADSPAGH